MAPPLSTGLLLSLPVSGSGNWKAPSGVKPSGLGEHGVWFSRFPELSLRDCDRAADFVTQILWIVFVTANHNLWPCITLTFWLRPNCQCCDFAGKLRDTVNVTYKGHEERKLSVCDKMQSKEWNLVRSLVPYRQLKLNKISFFRLTNTK